MREESNRCEERPLHRMGSIEKELVASLEMTVR